MNRNRLVIPKTQFKLAPTSRIGFPRRDASLLASLFADVNFPSSNNDQMSRGNPSLGWFLYVGFLEHSADFALLVKFIVTRIN